MSFLFEGESSMISNYKLDSEDEKIISELDDLCGVVQNKEVLKDIILYIKLRKNNKLNLGNYNILIRNNSSYNLLNDLINVCSKIFLKYNIIENDRICYLDKMVNSRRDNPFDKITVLDDSIIVINDGKLTFTSQNGYSISEPIDLVGETGWTFTTNISSGTTAGKVFESTQTVTYTEESAITLDTKLGDFLDLSDTIIYNHNVSNGSVNEKDLNDLAQDNYNKTAEELTVAEFLNILHWDLNYDTGFSDNGEISLSSYYLLFIIFLPIPHSLNPKNFNQ